ncbi:teichoic acids export ABC transporter ATP-binding subunit TagH [Neobacillus thermocopriae]|uniref:teichoic acids export ABC transporter ATP-binding subunit TagH n=1 Tax=Neobacillus thermocopriae TaxID=1215031 RepID=UPI0037706FD6
MNTSVIFQNVTKKYKMYKKKSDKILDLILPGGYGKDFYALQNVSFEAEKGDIIGIIGVNGAGKSTISNLIAGIVPPTSGKVKVYGESALISIGAGLNNQLTGRENIELKCLMLGFTKQEIQKLMPEIIEFAELGDFIDQPVKNYSSGMKSRLGFSISVNIDPDILVVDEALAVGDKIFAQKCLAKMKNFKKRGKTIFFISHSLYQIKSFCKKALWLEAGEIKAYGPVEEVLPQYEKFIQEFRQMSPEEKKQFYQGIQERRSKLNQPLGVSRVTSRRKPKKKKKAFHLLLFLSLLTLSIMILFGWNHLMSYFQADKHLKIVESGLDSDRMKQVEKEDTAKEVTQMPNQDIRYVHVASAYVRNLPQLAESEKITFVNFGETIFVEDVKKDPVQDFHWLKFTTKDQQEGWISEKLVTSLSSPSGNEPLIESIGNLVKDDKFYDNLLLFGKTKKEVRANDQLTFNSEGRVIELSYNVDSLSGDLLVATLGEPSLKLDDQQYLYHTKNYDFLFKSNGYTFQNVTVRPAKGN